MLKRIVNFFDTKTLTSKPLVVDANTYGINPASMSKDAIKVVRTLQKAGYEAYIVGGSVRDLLLGIHPKDFDVATDAQPAEVKSLFRRSRIIGRRFQIVHVQLSRELIEVTTFRSNEQSNGTTVASRSTQMQQNESGMLTRDNVFGSINEDAQRRDLTVNALYYNPTDNTIHDFTNGLEDIQNRIIRMIGVPDARYREDPVRILRVIRFTAKLGFKIEPSTAKPIAKLANNLSHVSPPRLFDETLKLFMSGKGSVTLSLLRNYSVFGALIPQADRLMNNGKSNAKQLIEQAFINTDLRISSNQRVTPAFIYAALLWPEVERLSNQLQEKGNSATYALSKAASEAISRQIVITAIPKRFTIPMREIWELQLQLPRRGGQRAKRLLEHSRFRAAYDFILLREQAGEDLNGMGEWWTQYQESDEEQKQAMSDAAGKISGKKRPRRNSRKKKVIED
jgi:poly(A) polymerase